MPLVEFLRQCRLIQQDTDTKIERAFVQCAAQPSPTELRLRKRPQSTTLDDSTASQSATLSVRPGGEWTTGAHHALSAACAALTLVSRVAATHVAVAPFVIPTDCLTLSPSAAFLVLYHYAFECAMQATRVTFDSQLNANLDAPESSSSASACAQALLEIADQHCVALQRVVSMKGNQPSTTCSPISLGFSSRSPTLLRAWLMIGFQGRYKDAIDVLEPTFGSLLDDDNDVVDLPTLGDALCLAAMASMLLGQPERALPLLTRAQHLSKLLQERSAGWLCSRGRRTLVFSLLLRGEARRVIHTQRQDQPDWIDDVRLAAKVSQDESRPFSGIPIDVTVQAIRYPPLPRSGATADDQQDDHTATPLSVLFVLPRLLHRLVHTYCGSLCVSTMSELTSNSNVIHHSAAATDDSSCAINSCVTQLFWYDVASLLSDKHHCFVDHLPNLCDEHRCWWPSSDDASSSQCQRIGGTSACCRVSIGDEPVEGTEQFQKVFLELLLAKNAQPSSTSSKSKVVKPLFASRTSGASSETNGGVWGSSGTTNDAADDLPRTTSASLRSRLFRTGGTRAESSAAAARTPTTVAFNTTFPAKEAKRSAEPPQVEAASSTAAPLAATFRRHTISSSVNVFDRLTTPASARGLRSNFTFGSVSTDAAPPQQEKAATPRPLSARTVRSSLPGNGDTPLSRKASIRPSSAGMHRSASTLGGSESARRAESRLANSMRDKINSTR